jgi:hypothetical protein
MVFVEMNKDTRLAENIADILAEIKSLVDIDTWQMRVRDLDDLIPFSVKNLIAALKKSAKHVAEQAILGYLQPSALDTAMIDDDLLILQGSGERFVFDVAGYDQIERLLTEHKLTEAGYSYSLRSVARTNRIARILGEGWLVLELDGFTMLHQVDTGHALLVR